jgi:hypothetical protein
VATTAAGDHSDELAELDRSIGKFASSPPAWLGGWMMLTASIVTISAVALAYQLTLPQIWSEFQIYGDGSGKYDFAANAVILGTVLIVFTTVSNALRSSP